jgi:glycerol kinase
MNRFLGIGVGTSFVKSVLIGWDQSVMARASSNFTVHRPNPGWPERSPSPDLPPAFGTRGNSIVHSIQLSRKRS